jgi:hypothetical protein
MKSPILKELRAAIEEWARVHNVETTLIDIKPSGKGSSIHVLVVARKGFENWPWYERHDSLFNFLNAKVDRTGSDVFISRLSPMTEEEYEKYEGVEA